MTIDDLDLDAADELPDPQEAFDEERRSAITSTDVAAILGLSRYGSPLSVYRDKRGESEPYETSLPAWIGQRLESLVSELYVSATGTPVRVDDGFYRHPDHPWLGAHLDRRGVGDGKLIVELKTRNSTRGWGADGSSDVPADVWCQVQVQAAVTGAREVHVATLFSNSSFRVYHVDPDPVFIAALIPDLEKFWFTNVVAGVPPAAGGSDVDSAIVAGTDGGNTGVVKAATPEHEQVVAEYRLARLNAAQAIFALKSGENRIKQLIGEDADGLRGGFGVIWWRRTKEVHTTDWESVAEVYRRATDALLELANPGEDDDRLTEYVTIRAQVEVAEGLYTKVRPGSRRFYVNLKED